MADKVTYVTDATGQARKVDQAQLPAAVEAGNQPISQQQAEDLTKAGQVQRQVDENYGTLGSAAVGALSGLTLGVAPGIMAAPGGIMDQDTLEALQTTGAYTAGDIAGTVVPAFLSGGESLALRGGAAAERGLLGTALGLTPAGLLNTAGGAVERFAGRFLPRTGSIGSKALTMAARGATEGAIINMGHTIGQNLVENKPLAGEALLAAGADGALFGGLIGGATGVVGGIGSAVAEKLPSAAGRVAGGRSLAPTARALGMSESRLAQAEAEGGLKSVLQGYRKVMDEEGSGVTFASRPEAIREAAGRQGRIYSLARESAVKELTEQAPTAVPRLDRVLARAEQEIVTPKIGTIVEGRAAKWFDKFRQELEPIETGVFNRRTVPELPPKPQALPEPTAAEFKKRTEVSRKVGRGGKETSYQWETDTDAFKKAHAKWKADTADALSKWEKDVEKARSAWEKTPMERFGSEGPGTWSSWIKTRDALEAKLGSLQGIDQAMAQDALRIMDSEIESAIRGADSAAGTSLADKFLAAQAGVKMAEELEKTVGKKAAQELLAHETTFTPRDLAVFGGMAAIGHPGTAAAWAAAKGLGRRINSKLEPAFAEMAYQNSIGARAAGAEQRAKFKIRESVRKFFRNSTTAVRKGSSVAKAQPKSKSTYSRKDFEEAASRAEQLVSDNHQQKVQRLIAGLEAAGYAELASHIGLTNQRAVQYLMANMPGRRAAADAASLRKPLKVRGLDMDEYQFLRKLNGISDPFSVLDKLNSGSMSRDEVRAMKYVYPELHSAIVHETAQQIADMKADGQYLPMDKVAHLGIMLDSPVDSILQPERVNAIQSSFVPPEQPKDSSPPQDSQFSTASLQTPIDSLA